MTARGDPVTSLSPEVKVLVTKLASVKEMIEQHKITVSLLERERLQLETQLRLAGYRTPARRAADG